MKKNICDMTFLKNVNISDTQKIILEYIDNNLLDDKQRVNINIQTFIKNFIIYECEDVLVNYLKKYLSTSRSDYTHLTKDVWYKEVYGDKLGNILKEKYIKSLEFAQKQSYKVKKRKLNWGHFFIDYWVEKGYSLEEAENIVKQRKNKAKENSYKVIKSRNDVLPTQLGYWIKKGYSEQDAKIKLAERQCTNSVKSIMKRNNCTRDEALKIRESITDKWQTALNSKSDEEKQEINRKKIHIQDHYMISKDETDLSVILKCNTQLIIPRDDNNTHYVYDMYKGKKIIEYNGDYWHCNPEKYKSDDYNESVGMLAEDIWIKDEAKIKFAESKGYEVLIVWESDYKSNKEEIINQCKEFLNVK